MTDTTTDTIAQTAPLPAPPPAQRSKKPGKRPPNPVLQQLATHYPALFGASPLPLKRGIFEDLSTALPDIPSEDLKTALGEHTRSTRYLQGVAASQPRHDLQAQAVEPMAVEHVFHAIVEIFRRKQKRGHATQAQTEEARQWLARRLKHSIDASGLTAQAYAERVNTKEPTAKALLEEVTSTITQQTAKDEALLSAFEASHANMHEFAEMYGLTMQEAGLVLARAQMHRQKTAVTSPA